MKKYLLHFFCAFAIMGMQAQKNRFWESHDASSAKIVTDKGVARASFPKEFKLFDLNIDPLRQTLFSVMENQISKKTTIISLPNVDGQIEEYEIYEASNFEPALQAQFPEIRAYSGKGITDKYATLKLSISPQGIQTMVFRTDKENEFIEPYSQDHTVYAVFKSNREKGKLPWTCTTEDQIFTSKVSTKESNTRKFDDGKLRVMRLAQSCTAEYANFFGATSAAQVGLVLTAFNNTLTRCNGVYEKDLALHLNLVANSTAVIFYDPATDPYATVVGALSPPGSWNASLQTTLTNTIGAANYDIGHLFGASGGGGNAGCIGCVCVDATKGRGITSPATGSVNPSAAFPPSGDTFDIDYVAHEVGHQLGGNHTFSNDNESVGVSKEVGSGITIMGYAGITAYDIAPHSIDIFHEASIQQIQTNLATKTCPVTTIITADNATPAVSPVSNYTIPKSTPFVLTGSATDANTGDALTYCWEQNDDGDTSVDAASSASITKVIGPNFISWSPTASPSRYFPKLSSTIANSATTAQVGGDTGMLSEALSSVPRDLNFRLTVRDNSPYSSVAPIKVGQTAFTDMKVTVSSAGPFVVNSPNTAVSWPVGSSQNVTWNVAGTTANGVNTASVDVFLSTDGGLTYPIQLASQVPNVGYATIITPNNVGTTNRIMVKGYQNVFFDISNTNFSIVTATSTFALATSGATTSEVCTLSSDATFNINYSALGGFSDTTTFSATGTPAGSIVTFSPETMSDTSGIVTMTVSNLSGATLGSAYVIQVNANSGATTNSVVFNLNVGLPTPTLSAPANNVIAQSTSLTLKWIVSPIATSYDVQVASDSDFTTIVSSGNAVTNSYNVTGLAQATSYYWRVLPKSTNCTGIYTPAFKFTTGIITCATTAYTGTPLVIPATLTAVFVGNSTLNIPTGTTISDVNVNLNISHTWVNDLKVTLKSPNNTVVTLFDRKCSATVANINVNAIFDDSGTDIVCNPGPTPAGISGTVIPLQSLSAFNGQNPVGNWILTVTDSFNGDGGSVASWGLNICSVSPPLAVVDNEFTDFSLYPNPNNGEFTLKLTSASSNDIKVGVHDMRGRSIFEKIYSNTGSFNQNVNLDKIQAGVYLVSITDGAKKTVKQIVIE
jgi:subtilisin-like proprotein convertase family protein